MRRHLTPGPGEAPPWLSDPEGEGREGERRLREPRGPSRKPRGPGRKQKPNSGPSGPGSSVLDKQQTQHWSRCVPGQPSIHLQGHVPVSHQHSSGKQGREGRVPWVTLLVSRPLTFSFLSSNPGQGLNPSRPFPPALSTHRHAPGTSHPPAPEPGHLSGSRSAELVYRGGSQALTQPRFRSHGRLRPLEPVLTLTRGSEEGTRSAGKRRNFHFGEEFTIAASKWPRGGWPGQIRGASEHS